MKKGIVISALILIFVGLTLFAWAFAASGFDISKLGTVECRTRTIEVSEDFSDIEIDAREADVYIEPSQDGKTSVAVVEQEKAPYSVSVEGGALRITREDKREWIDYIGINTQTMTIKLYLPEGEYGGLTVDSLAGHVNVDNAFRFGAITANTSAGGVSCAASSKGAIRIKTGTGAVKLEGLSAGSVDISVSTGGVTISSVECAGELGIKVSTGRATLQDVTCQSLVSYGSTGDVRLKNVIAEKKLEIKRSTGSVFFDACDAGSISIETSTGSVKGTLLTEKTFIAKTSTGSVSVPDTATGGKCEITTTTGSIEIKLAGD